MSDRQSFLVIIATAITIVGVILFALYNEGILMKNTYTNTLFDYTIDIPRGYQLGVAYMEYINLTERGGVTVGSSTAFIPTEAETVVLTTQDKSEQEKNIDILSRTPGMEIEQLCKCVVIATNVLPKPMAEFIRARDIKDGIAATTTPLQDPSGNPIPVYTNKLSAAAINAVDQSNLIALENEKHFTHLFFPEPFEFPLDSEYYDGINLTVYGLTLSMFTTDDQQASLQEVANAITF